VFVVNLMGCRWRTIVISAFEYTISIIKSSNQTNGPPSTAQIWWLGRTVGCFPTILLLQKCHRSLTQYFTGKRNRDFQTLPIHVTFWQNVRSWPSLRLSSTVSFGCRTPLYISSFASFPWMTSEAPFDQSCVELGMLRCLHPNFHLLPLWSTVQNCLYFSHSC